MAVRTDSLLALGQDEASSLLQVEQEHPAYYLPGTEDSAVVLDEVDGDSASWWPDSCGPCDALVLYLLTQSCGISQD